MNDKNNIYRCFIYYSFKLNEKDEQKLNKMKNIINALTEDKVCFNMACFKGSNLITYRILIKEKLCDKTQTIINKNRW